MPQLRDLKTEVFKVVHLDSNNRIIDIEDAATGTVNHAMPIVRELIREKQIRATKIGKWWIKPEDLEEFIKSRTNK